MDIRLSAALKSFLVFLLGIGLGILAYPQMRAAIADDRLLAACILGYLICVRLAGRAIARRELRKS